MTVWLSVKHTTSWASLLPYLYICHTYFLFHDMMSELESYLRWHVQESVGKIVKHPHLQAVKNRLHTIYAAITQNKGVCSPSTIQFICLCLVSGIAQKHVLLLCLLRFESDR